jgi:hypothetical protein
MPSGMAAALVAPQLVERVSQMGGPPWYIYKTDAPRCTLSPHCISSPVYKLTHGTPNL